MTDTLSGSAAMPEALVAAPLESPFTVPEHPCNVAFRQAQAAQLLKFLGTNLHRLVDGDEFQRAARHVRNFFAPELGIASCRICSFDIPQFLLPADRPVELIDPMLFGAQIAALTISGPDSECAVARNLTWLAELLHLTGVERKLLLWAYCAETEHPAVLNRVLGCMPCENWADSIEALSILLEEPAIAVAISLASPCRLRALRLMLTDTLRVPSSVSQCLEASETLVEVLETVHRSRSALLADLLEPRSHWTLQPESDVPDGLLVEWFDLPVAEVFVAARNERSMSAAQIAVAITWLTGWQIPAEQYQPLAGHLTFDLIELTVQRCFVEQGRRHRAVTVLALMQALYAAASAAAV
ncbi:hypothetical protein J2W28_006957 [Variovorax boronicumulans]|uniref:hypothetical protein n=1 Tax=Variovorax boronicumulans TaxID=436515 RepID=UPI00277D9F3F|nr:hypothetical protein [Variovorax boronicumulans]MDP9996464.1 hypothetical protein [Variovorax boronicumulans]MDQ0007778.1 hypothetical protein [Variovorax boronicumulans]